MLKLIRSIISPIVSLVMLVIGGGLFMTFISIRLKIDGYGPEIIGYVTSSFFGGLVLGSLRTHKLIERIGHIRSFAAFGALLIATIMLQWIYFNPWAWIALRFFHGYFTAGLYITIESWLLVKSTLQTRGRVMSIHMIAFYAGLSAGQFLLDIADPRGFYPFAYTILLASLALVPVCITRVTAPQMNKKSYLNLFHLIKIAPIGVIGCASSGMILGSVYGLNPVFAQTIGISISGVAKLMGITIFSGFLLQWPIGHLSDHMDRRKVIFVINCMVSILSLCIVWSSYQSLSLLLIASSIFGGFMFTLYPLSISHTIDLIDGDDMISATGALYVAYGIGAIIGPIIAAYSMDWFGVNSLFYFYSLIAFCTALFTAWRIFKKAPVPEEEKTSYSDTPKITPVGQQLNQHEPQQDEKSSCQNPHTD